MESESLDALNNQSAEIRSLRVIRVPVLNHGGTEDKETHGGSSRALVLKDKLSYSWISLIAASSNSSLPSLIPAIVGRISISGTMPIRCVSVPSG